MGLQLSPIRIFTVTQEHVGIRIDCFITSLFPGISRVKVQTCITQEFVKLNGAKTKKSAIVQLDDIVELNEDGFITEDAADLAPQNIPLSVIYEDEHILVVNKQAGLVVHPGNGNLDGTLVNALLYHRSKLSKGSADNRPGIVHRLDKNTSGAMVVARNDAVHNNLSKQFEMRTVFKEYLGVAIGIQPRIHSIIEGYISRSKRDPVRRWNSETVCEGGKFSKTEYFLEKYHSGMSLLRFRLHTGRTHQIRVHAKCKGFSLVMDTLYGSDSRRISRLEPLQRIFAHKIYKCFQRQALHAWKIGFNHPATGERVSFIAPLPEDFKAALSCFELNESDIGVSSVKSK